MCAVFEGAHMCADMYVHVAHTRNYTYVWAYMCRHKYTSTHMWMCVVCHTHVTHSQAFKGTYMCAFVCLVCPCTCMLGHVSMCAYV